MFKRITVSFVVAAFLFLISLSVQAFALDKKQIGLVKMGENKYEYSEGLLKHRLAVVPGEDGQTEVIDTLYWYNPDFINGPMPYTFPGDTVIQDFKLIPDPARLVAVRGIYGDGGLANFFVWEGDDGGTLGTPGTVLANKPWLVLGSSGALTWEQLDFSGDNIELPYSTDPDPANRPFFVIGYVCSGTGGNQGDGVPDIYYDFNETYTPDGPRGHSWFSYGGQTWFGIRYLGNQAWAQFVFEVIVNYYNGTSPFINSMSQLNDTWLTSGFQPVTAEVVDIDGSVDNAMLFYQVGFGMPDSVDATSVNGDIYSFDIPGTYSPGDSITYWIKATDNEGKSIVGTALNFKVLAPQNPSAEVLVVFENLDLGNSDVSIPAFWQPVLDAVVGDSLGKQYEVWDVNEHRGIDESIVNYPSFNTALVCGYGISSVPVFGYQNSVWKTFVENGNNLMIAAPDYLFNNGLTGEYNPIPGDFLKDVLGVGWVDSDPNDGAQNPNSLGDQIIIGMAGDPITNPWAALPIVFNFDVFIGLNWNDYVEADATNPNAATVFLGVASGKGNGVRNLTSYGGATLFLPFSLSAIADTTVNGDPVILPDAYKLLNRYFQWVNSVTSIEPTGSGIPLRYALAPNFPNPFNPVTTITYSIKEKQYVDLAVYNLLGEKVRTLVSQPQAPGVYRVQWDGRNDAGSTIASGVYVYKITAGEFSAARKMIFLK